MSVDSVPVRLLMGVRGCRVSPSTMVAIPGGGSSRRAAARTSASSSRVIRTRPLKTEPFSVRRRPTWRPPSSKRTFPVVETISALSQTASTSFSPKLNRPALLRVALLRALGEEGPRVAEIHEPVGIVVRDRDVAERPAVHGLEGHLDLLGHGVPRVLKQLEQHVRQATATRDPLQAFLVRLVPAGCVHHGSSCLRSNV